MASLFERNKKIVIAREEFCGICGKYVDKELKSPHPMSKEVDHIIPKNKGGSDRLSNLQLSHRICNAQKSDKIGFSKKENKKHKNRFEQTVIF